MAQITYTNKVALNENPEIADINKVTDSDMNEIKQVVNDNYNNTIQITDTEPTGDDWKIWIDSDKQTDNTYYNDNGTPTNIKTTTFDTLPVGTEVDYDGETVPSGWTEVESYSTTEEVDTGKIWIDGKKIFRKVFTGTTPNSATGSVNFNNEIDTLISEDIYVLSTSNYYVGRGYYESGTAQFSYTINKSTSVYFSTLATSVRNQSFTLIMEYTKP